MFQCKTAIYRDTCTMGRPNMTDQKPEVKVHIIHPTHAMLVGSDSKLPRGSNKTS